MKQATQLEIQWPEARTVEPRPSAVDRLEIRAARALSRALPLIKLFAQATLCVAFAFAIMFIAAIIQG